MTDWDEAAWTRCIEQGDWQTFTRNFAAQHTTTACEDGDLDEIREHVLDVFDELYGDYKSSLRHELARLQQQTTMTPEAFDAASRELYLSTMQATLDRLAAK